MSEKTRYLVTDTKTGRTGYAQFRGGYVLGGSYVNDHWEIRWNYDDTDQEQ